MNADLSRNLYLSEATEQPSSHHRANVGLPDIVMSPPSHQQCMVCGNNGFLPIQFRQVAENEVTAELMTQENWQGYTGIVHGGMTSTLLDAAMTHCLFAQGIEAVTASLNVRFHHPIPCKTPITISAYLTHQKRQVLYVEAKIFAHDQLLAYSTASFMRRPGYDRKSAL